MEKMKLWSTGLSAVLLSTTLLSGIASAADDKTEEAPTETTVIDSVAKKALEKVVKQAEPNAKNTEVSQGLVDTLNAEIRVAANLLKNPEATDEQFSAQTEKVKNANNAITTAKMDLDKAAKSSLKEQLDIYNKLDQVGASAATKDKLKKVFTTSQRVYDNVPASSAKALNGATIALKDAIETFKTEQAKDIAYTNGKAALKDSLDSAKSVQEKIGKDKVTVKLSQDLGAAITSGTTIHDAKDSTADNYAAAKATLDGLVTKINTELTDKAAYLSTAKSAIDTANGIDSTEKPTKLVKNLKDAITELTKKYDKSGSYTLAELKDDVTNVNAAGEAVKKQGKIFKVITGSDGKLTIGFATEDGQTVFPKGNKTTSSGVAKAEKGDDYIELNKVEELVSKYGLEIPVGFELVNPSKAIVQKEDVTKVLLKQKENATFDQAYVTFNFQINGKDVAAAGEYGTFSSLQDTTTVLNASDVINEVKNTDATAYKELKKHFYKSGYTLDSKSKSYNLSKSNFYQTYTMNFVKKAAAPIKIDVPEVLTFKSTEAKYHLVTGYKYSTKHLTDRVFFMAKNTSNRELDKKKYKITITKVYKYTDKKERNILKKSTVVMSHANANYVVKFKVEPAEGYKLSTNSQALTYTAKVFTKDSAPTFTNVKNETIKVGKFKGYLKDSAGKAITAYDFVDKKNVKVTYTGKVSPKTPGTYKIYYTAKDSKGNVAKKTRTVKIVK